MGDTVSSAIARRDRSPESGSGSQPSAVGLSATLTCIFFKSSSGLTLLRTAWLVCFFVISNPAQCCSANTPPNPRRVDKAGILGKKVTFNEATRLICTPLQLVVARQLEYDISPWGLLVHKQPSYRSVFAVERTLRSERRSGARQRSEHQNERSQCGNSVKSRDVSPGSGPSSGGWFFFFFCETGCRSFPAFVRSGRSRCSPTVSYRNGVTLCCSVASASAAQTVGAPRCCCPKNPDPCCGCCIYRCRNDAFTLVQSVRGSRLVFQQQTT